MLKKGLFLLSILALLLVSAPAFAAADYYTCDVLSVGVGKPSTSYPNGLYAVRLTDVGGTFTDVQFIVSYDDYSDRFMAVFLTAIGTGQKVLVYVDPNSPYSINNVSILNQ